VTDSAPQPDTSTSLLQRVRGISGRTAVAVLVASLVVAALVAWTRHDGRRVITAEFDKTVSLYVGSDVRIMGVPVGVIERVTPQGTGVEVRMRVDDGIRLPTNVGAFVISPSIVGDRYVQLSPAYTGGEELVGDATLDATRTDVPLELDDVYQGIDDLTVALGPQGANRNGALSQLLDATARNFGGQGEKFHQTIVDLGRLTGTLDDNKDAFFGSARELEGFINTLATSDTKVRDFNQSLAQISSLLAGERGELSASLHNLAIALTQVSSFVRENRDSLGRNIHGLVKVTDVLVKQRAALDEILRAGPAALTNLNLTYNPQAGTLDTRSNVDNLTNQLTNDPALLLCTLVGNTDRSGRACNLIKQALPRPAVGATPPREQVDPTLAGLVQPR
jgi:phospholipid/cholesterol/gamma-HCH transport system substrate-binding protein